MSQPNSEKGLLMDNEDLQTLSESLSKIQATLKKYNKDLPTDSTTRKIEASSNLKYVFDMNLRDAQVNTLMNLFADHIYGLLSQMGSPFSKESLNHANDEFDDLIDQFASYMQDFKKNAIKEGIEYLREQAEDLDKTSKELGITSKELKQESKTLEKEYKNSNNGIKANKETKEKSTNNSKVSQFKSSKEPEEPEEKEEEIQSESLKESKENENSESDSEDISDESILEIKNLIESSKNEIKRIEARKTDKKDHYNINFNMGSEDIFKIYARKPESGKAPIKGILFEINKPSEEIPNVGPGMPLYIPEEVAIKATNTIIGYPLDADPSLKKHKKTNIIGIIENAYIEENNFIIEGNLWVNNKEDHVQKIIDNKEILGLSMNADASGHKTTIEGQEVFHIDNLHIWGANILYSELATYPKAKILAQSNLKTEEDETIIKEQYAITAEKTDLNSGSNNMDEKTRDEILGSLKSLHNSFTEHQRVQAEKNKNLEEDLESLKSTVQTYEQERKEIEAQKTKEQTQKEKEEERNALIEAVKEQVGELVEEKVEAIKNPSGEPKRKTKPASSSSSKESGESQEVTDLRLQLARINGALEQAQNLTFEKQIALQEEKTQTENKLKMVVG